MSPSKASKKSKYSAARWVGSPKISKIRDQFLKVLQREAGRLMDESHKEKLSPESSKKLVNYLEAIMDLEKREPKKSPDPKPSQEDDDDDLAQFSDEDLKKMANKGENNV
jgi:hypothetical protein